METQYHSLMPHQDRHEYRRQVSVKTMMIATVVGITIGGPLLAVMGFIFLATMSLFVVTSPLLVIFSPVILGALFVVVTALAGFGAAGLLAIAGVWALGWVLRFGQLQLGLESVTGENVKNIKGKEYWVNQTVPENVQSSGVL